MEEKKEITKILISKITKIHTKKKECITIHTL